MLKTIVYRINIICKNNLENSTAPTGSKYFRRLNRKKNKPIREFSVEWTCETHLTLGGWPRCCWTPGNWTLCTCKIPHWLKQNRNRSVTVGVFPFKHSSQREKWKIHPFVFFVRALGFRGVTWEIYTSLRTTTRFKVEIELWTRFFEPSYTIVDRFIKPIDKQIYKNRIYLLAFGFGLSSFDTNLIARTIDIKCLS